MPTSQIEHSPTSAPPAPRRSPYIAVAAFFLILLAVGGLALIPKLHHRQALRTEATAASGPPIVLATRLSAADRTSRLELPASIQAFEQTTIYARTSGYVRNRFVDIGDHVRKGQLLAEIEDPQTAQSLLQAKAALAQTEAQLLQSQANADLSSVTNQRWQSLQAAGVVAQQDADQKRAQSRADAAAVTAARANIAASQANVASLTQQAGFSRVTAPFDGIVLSRAIDRGSLISSGSQTAAQQMFTLAQADTVRVFANIPQSNSVGLRTGQVAQVAIRELGGQTFPGTIARTSQSLDPTTRTLLVEVDLKNDGRILPGMYATVRFDLPPTAAAPVLLPANALVIRSAGPQAIVIDSNNTAHFRALTLGRDLGGATEVLAGVQPGDLVALSPGDDVTEGAKVQPQIQPASTPDR